MEIECEDASSTSSEAVISTSYKSVLVPDVHQDHLTGA